MSAAVELADRRRRGEEVAQTELLDAAADVDDYQHALIHAGFVEAVDEDGDPAEECPACGAAIAR